MKVFSVLVVCFMALPHGVKSWLYTSSPQAGWSPTVGSHNGDSKTTPFMLPKEHQYLPKILKESSRTKKDTFYCTKTFI